MSQRIKALLLMTALILGVLSPLRTAEAKTKLTTVVNGIPNEPIYCACSTKSGEHLYTSSLEEAEGLAASGEWVNEGICWYAPKSSKEPVYRLYNPITGAHLYSGYSPEIEQLKGQGWQIDRQGTPAFYSGGSVEVYRLYNNRIHYLTSDKSEHDTLSKQGWTSDGVVFNATTKTAFKKYPMGESDISNTPCEYAIQADVTLSGQGSGYHAKLVACTPTSAISFGIQYDVAGKRPYNGKVAFIIENVYNNNAGGQTYIQTGYSAVKQTFRLLMAIQKDGTCDVYVNGGKVRTVKNSKLDGKNLALRVEGSCRKNGDSVKATFKNIKLKSKGVYKKDRKWHPCILDTNKGLRSDIDNFKDSRMVVIQGTMNGIKKNEDWDSAFTSVSGIVQFN